MHWVLTVRKDQEKCSEKEGNLKNCQDCTATTIHLEEGASWWVNPVEQNSP